MNGWMDGHTLHLTPTWGLFHLIGSGVLGNLDSPYAQMVPGFQGPAKHIHLAQQVLANIFHTLPGGSGAVLLGLDRGSGTHI